MSKALVLINTTSGSQQQVLMDIKKILGVNAVYSSQGIYDLVVRVQAGSIDELKGIVFSQIKPINNVQTTLTLTLTE